MKKTMLICVIFLSLIVATGCGGKEENVAKQSSSSQTTTTERKKFPKDQVVKEEMDLFIPAAKFFGLTEQSVYNLVKLLKIEMGVDFNYIKGLKSCNLDGIKFALKAPKGEQLIGDTLWIPLIRQDGTPVSKVVIKYENEKYTKDENLRDAQYILYDNAGRSDGNQGDFSDIIVSEKTIEKMKEEMKNYIQKINGSAKGTTEAVPFMLPVRDPYGQSYLPIVMIGQKYIVASEIYGEKEKSTGSAMIFDAHGNLLKHYNGNEFYAHYKSGNLFDLREKPVKTPSEMILTFKSSISQLDTEISNLAKDVNLYLQKHQDFKQDIELINRATKLLKKIEDVNNTIIGYRSNYLYENRDKSPSNTDVNIKILDKLIELTREEKTRIEGLYYGMGSSKDGRDYRPDFERGGRAYERFKKLYDELNRML